MSWEPNHNSPSRLAILHPDGGNFRDVILGDTAACGKTYYRAMSSLADGRLAVLRECDSLNVTFSIVAYDITKGWSEETLVPSLRYNANQFTWAPDLGRGLFEQSSGICGGITTMTRSGPGSLPVSIEGGRGSWRIDEGVNPADDCSQQGRAILPAWSPNGREVAFFASPESIGHKGTDRLAVPYGLYLMDSKILDPKRTSIDVLQPQTLQWSPTGQWLAFSGTVGTRRGTYLWRPADNQLWQISSDFFLNLAWSPDSRRLVGAVQPDGRPSLEQIDQYSLVILDVDQVTDSVTSR